MLKLEIQNHWKSLSPLLEMSRNHSEVSITHRSLLCNQVMGFQFGVCQFGFNHVFLWTKSCLMSGSSYFFISHLTLLFLFGFDHCIVYCLMWDLKCVFNMCFELKTILICCVLNWRLSYGGSEVCIYVTKSETNFYNTRIGLKFINPKPIESEPNPNGHPISQA